MAALDNFMNVFGTTLTKLDATGPHGGIDLNPVHAVVIPRSRPDRVIGSHLTFCTPLLAYL